MGDSKWKTDLDPVCPSAVKFLSNLVDGPLLDHLLAKGLLTAHHYEEIIKIVKSEGEVKAARRLFMIVRKCAAPSFDTFLAILLNVDGGRDLYRCLTCLTWPQRSSARTIGSSTGANDGSSSTTTTVLRIHQSVAKLLEPSRKMPSSKTSSGRTIGSSTGGNDGGGGGGGGGGGSSSSSSSRVSLPRIHQLVAELPEPNRKVPSSRTSSGRTIGSSTGGNDGSNRVSLPSIHQPVAKLPEPSRKISSSRTRTQRKGPYNRSSDMLSGRRSISKSSKVWVFIDEELQGEYAIVKESFRRMLQKAVKLGDEEKSQVCQFEVQEGFVPDLQVQRVLGTRQLMVPKTCLVKIILPQSSPEAFSVQKEWALSGISGLMQVPFKLIDVQPGCCVLTLEVPGRGLMNFICALEDGSNFSFLLAIDCLIEFKFDALRPFSLARLFIRDSPRSKIGSLVIHEWLNGFMCRRLSKYVYPQNMTPLRQLSDYNTNSIAQLRSRLNGISLAFHLHHRGEKLEEDSNFKKMIQLSLSNSEADRLLLSLQKQRAILTAALQVAKTLAAKLKIKVDLAVIDRDLEKKSSRFPAAVRLTLPQRSSARTIGSSTNDGSSSRVSPPRIHQPVAKLPELVNRQPLQAAKALPAKLEVKADLAVIDRDLEKRSSQFPAAVRLHPGNCSLDSNIVNFVWKHPKRRLAMEQAIGPSIVVLWKSTTEELLIIPIENKDTKFVDWEKKCQRNFTAHQKQYDCKRLGPIHPQRWDSIIQMAKEAKSLDNVDILLSPKEQLLTVVGQRHVVSTMVRSLSSVSSIAGLVDRLCDEIAVDEKFQEEIGKLSEQILEQMQQSLCFNAEEVDRIQGYPPIRRSYQILEFVRKGSVKVKEEFVHALFVTKVEILHKAAPDILRFLSQSSLREYVKVGGISIQKKYFENRLEMNLEELKAEIVIVLIGQSGVGKSSLINSLLGPDSPRRAMECDPEPLLYQTELSGILPNKVSLKLWDTPGLFDMCVGEEESQKKRTNTSLEKIKREVQPDLVLFCVDCPNPRMTRMDVQIVKSITHVFGKEIWEHAILVLTKANCIREASAGLYRVKKTKSAAYERLLAHSVPVPLVAVGSRRDRVLADGTAWLPEFWVTAIKTARTKFDKFALIPSQTKPVVMPSEEGKKTRRQRCLLM